MRFLVGRTPGGRLRIRGRPLYEITRWRRRPANDRLVYRPTLDAVAYHARPSLMAAAVVAAICWWAGTPWSRLAAESASAPAATRPSESRADDSAQAELDSALAAVEQGLSEESRRKFHRRNHERIARLQATGEQNARRNRSLAIVGEASYWGALALFGLAAVTPIAWHPWRRLEIWRSPEGALVVRRRGLWWSRRQWPPAAFGGIEYRLEEDVALRWGRRVPRTLGWRWIVRLAPSASRLVGEAASMLDAPIVEFQVDYQRRKPDPTAPPPDTVGAFMCDLADVFRHATPRSTV